jgi:hypothetical protein
MRKPGFFPPGIKVGDFVQTDSHFSDIFFEVTRVTAPDDDSDYWSVTFVSYEKYGGTPREQSVNSAGSIRQFYPAEMAVPVMLFKRQRFRALFGQYDPFYGFAPAGTPLRKKLN